MMNLGRFSGAMQSKPVEQLDLQTGEVIKEWESKSEVERKMRISNHYMNNVLKGKTNETGGFGWRYK